MLLGRVTCIAVRQALIFQRRLMSLRRTVFRQASELIVTNVRHLAVLQGDAAISAAEEELARGLGITKAAQC
jgi:hypothetical protein